MIMKNITSKSVDTRTAKAVLRGKFIPLNAYISKEESLTSMIQGTTSRN